VYLKAFLEAILLEDWIREHAWKGWIVSLLAKLTLYTILAPMRSVPCQKMQAPAVACEDSRA
jgi:hypothetical protein